MRALGVSQMLGKQSAWSSWAGEERGETVREIPLTQGQVALVDDEDFDVLTTRKWQASWRGWTFYAHRIMRIPGGGRITVKMHRVVLARKLGRPLVKGEEAEHEDGNGLDNRRSKLRLATHAQNMRNITHRMASHSSRYLGVSWHKAGKKWIAQILINGKVVYLGLHPTELEAAQARERYITAHPELMARSNFPEAVAPAR